MPQTHASIVATMPVLFAVLTMWYCLQPNRFTPLVDMIPISNYTETLEDTVAYPGTIPQAYQLGKILATESVSDRLQKARVLLNAPKMTELNLQTLVQELESGEENGMFQKALGFINFVNVMWLLAILGLMVSVGPFVAIWIGPFVIKFMRKVAEETVRICEFLYEATWEYHDLFCTLASFVVMLCNERFRVGTKEFIALTGCLMLSACYFSFFYSRVRGFDQERHQTQKMHSIAEMAAVVATGSLALKLDSQLLGSFTVVTLYHLIGFGVWSEPLVVYVGFDDEKALVQATGTSAVFVVMFIVLRTVKITPLFLQPFSWTLQALGSTCFYLGLLIGQHIYYREKHPAFHFVLPVSLMLGLFVGSVLGIPSIFNSSVVFVVLYVLDFTATLRMWRDPAKLWAGIFVGSFFVFRLSLWMKTNPEWINHVFMN